MNRSMKCWLAMCCVVLAGCTHDRASANTAEAVHREAITRGSTAPAAPVQLTYQVPATIAANQPATIEVAINTRLDRGAMLVEVAGQDGVSVIGDSQYRYDLAAVSARPILLQLQVLPADRAERFLAVLITVDTEMGAMVRSFRIDLKAPSAAPADARQAPVGGPIQQ